MTEIVSVRFKDAGKVYYFDPNGLKVRIGDNVIVETARGVECATVAAANRFVEDDSLVSPLKPILRIATAEDKATLENKAMFTINFAWTCNGNTRDIILK